MSIVLVGSFNPAIFHSAWFAKFGLLPEEEASDVREQVILTDFAQFTLAWAQVQVTPDRFQVSTTDPEAFNVLRDLAIGTFRILSHSPVRAVGVNRDQHFRVDTVARWHEIGLTLAPAKPWSGPLASPGVRSLLMEGVRTDGYAGYVHVRVEPSRLVFPGVYIGVNDHYQLNDDERNIPDADEAVRVLEQQWDGILQRVPPLVDVVLSAKASPADRTEAVRRADKYVAHNAGVASAGELRPEPAKKSRRRRKDDSAQ